MSNVSGGTVTVTIAGKDVGLTDLLTKVNAQMAASGQSARTYATQMATLTPAVSSVEKALAQYTVGLANVARAQGDTLGAQKLLVNGLQGITTNTTAANTVLLKLQQTLNAEAAAAEKDAAALAKLNIQKQQLASTPPAPTSGIDAHTISLGKLVTGYFAATRVIKEFGQVVGEGNELEKTLTTFKVLSGSQEQYTKNLALAKEQQNLFGGSLQDTVEGMSSFANLSARTGIEITKLTNTARALAIIDPAQGFKGAGIALKEFFSGEITSLARRFEIPREALTGVEKITDNVDKFAALQKVLEQYGISQELVTAQANTTAVAYEKLSGSLADARAAIGGALAVSLQETAVGFTNVFTNITNGFNTLVSRKDQLAGFSGEIFKDTSSIDQFNAKVREVNASTNSSENAIASYLARINELTPAQYAFVLALTSTGVSAQEAFSQLEQNATAMDAIAAAGAHAAEVFPTATNAINALSIGLAEVAATGTEGTAVAIGLANAVEAGLPIEQASIYLSQYKANVVRQVAEEQANLTVQEQAVTAALDEEIIKTIADNQAKTENKIITEGLNAVLQALSAGTITQAQAEGILQGQYNATSAQLPGLINLTYELAAARDAARIAGNALNQAETNAAVNRNRDIGRQGRGDSSDAAENSKALVKSLQEAAKAESDALLRNGTAAQKRGEYNKRLADSVKLYGQNSAAAIKARADLEAFDASQDKKAKGGGGSAGSAPKLTANEKLNTALQDQQDKFNDKFEDAEEKHWDKVADIYEKFSQKQQEQFAKNEVSKRRSRADFYSGLQDAPAGVDTQKFAAQYEEAFAKAQEIAQTGKAKLANEFLELRQRQIEEMKSLDEEAAKISEGQKEGKISKKDADAQLAYLEGRRKLIEDAQREEQQLLLQNGDENVNNLNEQLAAENKAYDESADKIGTAAERAANAKITHAQRSKIAVSEENKELANQQAYYERIAKVNGGQVPKSQQGTAPTSPNAGVQGTADAPVHIDATEPIPITTPESLLVRQAELFLVHDADVMASIGDMATRIESKLGEVIAAVNNANNGISTAVNGVRDAVGRIRIASPSVVGA